MFLLACQLVMAHSMTRVMVPGVEALESWKPMSWPGIGIQASRLKYVLENKSTGAGILLCVLLTEYHLFPKENPVLRSINTVKSTCSSRALEPKIRLRFYYTKYPLLNKPHTSNQKSMKFNFVLEIRGNTDYYYYIFQFEGIKKFQWLDFHFPTFTLGLWYVFPMYTHPYVIMVVLRTGNRRKVPQTWYSWECEWESIWKIEDSPWHLATQWEFMSSISVLNLSSSKCVLSNRVVPLPLYARSRYITFYLPGFYGISTLLTQTRLFVSKVNR